MLWSWGGRGGGKGKWGIKRLPPAPLICTTASEVQEGTAAWELSRQERLRKRLQQLARDHVSASGGGREGARS